MRGGSFGFIKILTSAKADTEHDGAAVGVRPRKIIKVVSHHLRQSGMRKCLFKGRRNYFESDESGR